MGGMVATRVAVVLLALAGSAHAVPKHLAAKATKATVRGKPGARITVPVLTDMSEFCTVACGVMDPLRVDVSSRQTREALHQKLVSQGGTTTVPSVGHAHEHTFEIAYDELGLKPGDYVRVVSTWPSARGVHVWGQGNGTELQLPH